MLRRVGARFLAPSHILNALLASIGAAVTYCQGGAMQDEVAVLFAVWWAGLYAIDIALILTIATVIHVGQSIMKNNPYDDIT